MRSHISWEGERSKGVKTFLLHTRFKILRGNPKGRAQRGQYQLVVGLDCYIVLKAHPGKNKALGSDEALKKLCDNTSTTRLWSTNMSTINSIMQGIGEGERVMI